MEQPNLSRARLLIFDLDGTLVDTLEPTFYCFQQAVLPVLGRTPSREEILARFGPADHQIVAEWVGESYAAAAVERLYACYESAFRHAGPFPGMIDLVRDARAEGKQTAIFTGRGRASTDAILTGMGLQDLFDAVVCGDEVEHPKPAPDGLLKILEALNMDPGSAVYIGDTVKDVEAARGAGVHCVAALWGSPEQHILRIKGSPTAELPNDLRRMILSRP